MAALALAACGGAGGTTGGITVSDAWARTSPMMERAGAAYMVLQNGGAAEDKLLSVEGDVAQDDRTARDERDERHDADVACAQHPVPAAARPS